jgi:hypothetical protein
VFRDQFFNFPQFSLSKSDISQCSIRNSNYHWTDRHIVGVIFAKKHMMPESSGMFGRGIYFADLEAGAHRKALIDIIITSHGRE